MKRKFAFGIIIMCFLVSTTGCNKSYLSSGFELAVIAGANTLVNEESYNVLGDTNILSDGLGASVVLSWVSEGEAFHLSIPQSVLVNDVSDIARFAVQPEQPIRGLDIASEWATESITRAHYLGLIPASLFAFPTFTDYTLPTTRAEFAALAVALYEVATSREITGRMEFNDTSDTNVQKMGYLGVVTGVGGGNFAPDDTLTREQAAVMLVRLINAIPQLVPQVSLTPEYLAATDISSWAVQSVHSLKAAGIMTGMGDGGFAPQSPLTREQSIVMIMSAYDFIS